VKIKAVWLITYIGTSWRVSLLKRQENLRVIYYNMHNVKLNFKIKLTRFNIGILLSGGYLFAATGHPAHYII